MTMLNPQDTVRVRGANTPRNIQPPPPPPTPTGSSSSPGFFQALGDVFSRAGQGFMDWFNQPRVHERDVWGSMAPNPIPFGGQPAPAPEPDTSGRRILGPGELIPSPSVPFQPLPISPQDGFLEMYGGQFDSTPYDNYINFLMQQDEETMARINAMYAQLAESAEGNMQRIQDIYGSAQRQSGDVFGGSAQNIEDAYASASQQAADQMARLGVEAAAPAVLNPMALSQAEAVSGIERAGAGALDALMRYGTTAQDFGSQMGQVAQQQGLEVSSSILRDIARRQAEAAFMREQARADFNPYQNAMRRLEYESAFNAPAIQAQQAQQALIEAETEAYRLQTQTTLSRRDKITSIVQSLISGGMDPQIAQETAEAMVARAEQLYPM